LQRAISAANDVGPVQQAVFAISGPIETLAELRGVHDEVSKAVRVRIHLGGPAGCFQMRSLGASRFLLRAADSSELAELCRSTLAEVLTYDAGHGTELLLTYRTYLRESGRLQRTAQALGVHIHT